MSTNNIPAILIANIMGITILFVVGIGNFYKTRAVFKENQIIKIMFIVCLISCIVGPICFLVDGKSGVLNHILVFVCNTWLYFGNIITSYLWIKLIVKHLDKKFSKLEKTILLSISAVGCILLIINIFVPIVFSVDANNVYARSIFYFVYIAIFILFLLYGLIVYFMERRKIENLKFFPIWAFVIPPTIGMIIQTIFYGVSTITPFVTISIVCVLICLQNELLYRDKLTGVYNRFYLKLLEKTLDKRLNEKKYIAVMIDINNFKLINDNFGHKVGDQALIDCANILKNAVGKKGEVVRYAGDEFILLVRNLAENDIDNFINKIHQKFAEFSNREDVTYKLSVSMGCDKLYLKDGSLDHFLDKIDKLMYESKRKHKEKMKD